MVSEDSDTPTLALWVPCSASELLDQFANYGWLDLWSNLPSKLSFNLGLTEFQNTLLPNAQEYVDVFLDIHII